MPAADPMMIHFLATLCTMATLAKTPKSPAMAMMMGAARDTSKASPSSAELSLSEPLFSVVIIRGLPSMTSALKGGEVVE